MRENKNALPINQPTDSPSSSLSVYSSHLLKKLELEERERESFRFLSVCKIRSHWDRESIQFYKVLGLWMHWLSWSYRSIEVSLIDLVSVFFTGADKNVTFTMWPCLILLPSLHFYLMGFEIYHGYWDLMALVTCHFECLCCFHCVASGRWRTGWLSVACVVQGVSKL